MSHEARLCRDPELWAIVVASLRRRDVRWWIFHSYGDREARGLASELAAPMLHDGAAAQLRAARMHYR